MNKQSKEMAKLALSGFIGKEGSKISVLLISVKYLLSQIILLLPVEAMPTSYRLCRTA